MVKFRRKRSYKRKQAGRIYGKEREKKGKSEAAVRLFRQSAVRVTRAVEVPQIVYDRGGGNDADGVRVGSAGGVFAEGRARLHRAARFARGAAVEGRLAVFMLGAAGRGKQLPDCVLQQLYADRAEQLLAHADHG